MSVGLPRVLVVDDDPHITSIIKLYLEKEGFLVSVAGDGSEALKLIDQLEPDVVVLDIMMPKVDGLQVCRRVRLTRRTPIIMLTAKGEVEDRILGLDLGADDYLTKPFSVRELVSRIKAILRRVDRDIPEADRVLTFPGLSVDAGRYEIEIDGERKALTPKEFELLWFLASHPGRVFSRDQILDKVWGYDYFGDTRTVDVHVKRLRQKIGEDEAGPRYLKTVWGAGYKFEVEKT
ncbi:MAG: response regulator transcription factor [Actinobacteria bacterium]|nr:response regulator transcription factor [Actinomycetota bacterium]